MTNFEKIKRILVEELANQAWVVECQYCPTPNDDCSYIGCDKAWGKWLNEEVKTDDER